MPGLHLTRKLPAFNGNVSAGNTVTMRMPIGLTTHQVLIEYSFTDGCCCAVTLANAVGEIRVLLNGKVIWNIQASELDTLNQYLGRAAAAGVLTLDFDRFNLRTRLGEELTAIGTGVPLRPEDRADPTANIVSTFVIEMDISAGVAAGTLDARVIQSESVPLGAIRKVRRFTEAFGGAGDVDITEYPKGDRINMVALFESANDIDRLKIYRDQYEMFDRTKEVNTKVQTDGVRVPQANLFVYDPTEKGNGGNQLLTRYPNGERVNDLRFTATLDGAMTITSIVDYIGALES